MNLSLFREQVKLFITVPEIKVIFTNNLKGQESEAKFILSDIFPDPIKN